MEEKNELNDIILNKGETTNGKKKILLAVATLGIVLIIVIVLMSKLTPDAQTNLPQPNSLPKEKVNSQPKFNEEPLFEEVDVIEEDSQNNDNLDEIAQRLKQESKQESKTLVKKKTEQKIIQKQMPKTKPKKHIYKRPTPKKKVVHKKVNKAKGGRYYVQVGSFSIYKPNKKFLNSISKLNYNYKFHKVGELNKVLVGPFSTEKEARKALKVLKKEVEHGSFLTKI